jgi:hypothetical protein
MYRCHHFVHDHFKNYAQMKKKRPKRPMLLLEILIAMSLVSLCIAPLIKGPLDMHRAEMSHLTRIEAGRIAAWTFTEIVEKILKNELRWEQLPKLGQESPAIILSDVPLKLPPLPAKSTLARKFTLATLKEKRVKDGPIHRLIAVHLEIGGREFTYRTIVTKLPSTSSID